MRVSVVVNKEKAGTPGFFREKAGNMRGRLDIG